MTPVLLALDIGNTTTTIGLFDQAGTALFFSSIETQKRKTGDQCAIDLLGVFSLHGRDLSAVTDSIISCVVPSLQDSYVQAILRLVGSAPLVIGPGVKTGLNIRSDLHQQLGADMVALSVAALSQYPSPILAIGMGTATTFSFLSNGTYEGCSICPGIGLGLTALSEQASGLPQISLALPPDPLGHNTVDAMRAGVLYGHASMVDGMIDRFEQAYGKPIQTVVATGSQAPFVIEHCTHTIQYNPHLLMEGLAIIHEKNQGKFRK